MGSPDYSDRSLGARIYHEALTTHRDAVDRLGETHMGALLDLADDVAAAWSAGDKLLICGNGGSAADAQHIAAELVGRFEADRDAYAALALTTNASILTAVGNDYGFTDIFARQVTGLGASGDVLLVISTSGNSDNCVKAVAAARDRKMRVHGFLGRDGGTLAGLVDGALIVPAADTATIQELHITLGHVLCRILETWRDGNDSDTETQCARSSLNPST